MKFKFKFRYAVRGGHAHVQMFAGSKESDTLGRAGSFVLRVEEFEEFLEKLSTEENVEFVESNGRNE